MRSLSIAIRGRSSGDDGYAIVYLAIASAVILGMAALVIDVGLGWRTRRSLVAASDSAALAVAQEAARGYNGCLTWYSTDHVDDELVDRNEASASVIDCDISSVGSDRIGWISVTAGSNVDTPFAAAAGGDQDLDVRSTSAAMIGPPITVTNLRPIGLCYHGIADLRYWMDNPPVYGAEYLRVYRPHEQLQACGLDSSIGNWAVIDFDGGSNSEAEMGEQLRNGYDGEIHYSDDPITDCDGVVSCYPVDFDVEVSDYDLHDAIHHLEDGYEWVTLPVFDVFDEGGPDAGDEMVRIMGFVRVQPRYHELTSAPEYQYLKFNIKAGLVTGMCCGQVGDDGGNRVIALCAVDLPAGPDPTGDCSQ